MTGAPDVSALVAAIARKREPLERRTFSQVRRHSRPRGDTRGVCLTWAECNERIRALRRWERKQARDPRKRNRAVGHVGVAVYEFMARRAVNRRGRLDDLSYEAIGAIVGHARSAVVAAMQRLKAHGWMDWARQYEPTGKPGARGPQVKQTVNFYWICAPIAGLLKLGIRFGPPPPPDDHDHARAAGAAANKAAEFAESKLGEAIAALGDAILQRETS